MSRRDSRVPRVTAAAGCGGHGPELARFGDLAALDAVLLGPIGLARDGGAATGPALQQVPGALLHRRATAIPPAEVVAEHLPWLAARQLPVVCAVRGDTVADVAEVVTRLRRSLDFGSVTGLEVDLTDRSGDGAGFQVDQQACLRLMSRLRELLPRDLPVLAKIGIECPDPVAVARSSIAGGAAALVVDGSVPAHPAGVRLGGRPIAAVTLGAVARMRAAVEQGRVPDVPVLASGGVSDADSARRALAAGAHGVQVGTALFADPAVIWRVADAVRSGPDAPELVEQQPEEQG